MFRLVRWLTRRAEITADQLSPHALRHTATTDLLDTGLPLRDVQDFAGHADPRTTRRYDRSRNKLDRRGSYTLAARLARAEDEEPGRVLRTITRDRAVRRSLPRSRRPGTCGALTRSATGAYRIVRYRDVIPGTTVHPRRKGQETRLVSHQVMDNDLPLRLPAGGLP